MPRLHVVADALLGALALAVLEWAFATWSGRREFVGPWELRAGFVRLLPLAWLAVIPAALLGALVLALGALRERWSQGLAALIALAGGVALGVGVSGGRHFAFVPGRVAFVALVAGVATVAVMRGLRDAVERLDRAPVLAGLGALLLAGGLEAANVLILPRLYPAFHAALVALAAMLSPLWGRLLPPLDVRDGARDPSAWRLLILALPLWLGVNVMSHARALAQADNVRFIFMTRSPVMSRGVELAARLAPPPPLEDGPVDLPRVDDRLHLDWRASDILLISVDALRADHVGAYGYPRRTTPRLDALATEGTLFLRAYCPTPHTSYSVTSMMTGKNMRPLLLQGLGSESDTTAGLLRTYGYRTAAFYPPAVFFVDEEAFVRYRDRRLDFEYARIEFAAPSERATALRRYMKTQPSERKLFVWVHLFEPHEPYVAHPEHRWGDRDVDRYDSEIAAADDGIGELLAIMRERSPHAVVIVTADHGEEFGDHQGRYHGTTVYEEQVRVPMVVVGPGVAAGRRVQAPVQTIDLMPTILAALDIPRPPRVRGNELSGWLATDERSRRATAAGGGREGARDFSAPAPPAFAETDEQTLLADGQWRLICARKVGACALYDIDVDPSEQRDVASAQQARVKEMRAKLARLQGSHGTYETAPGARPWPDALRRGLSGDVDAAADVAELLDDSDVTFRRKAGEVLFDLRNKAAAPQLRLALSRDDDDLVRRWSVLSLARLGDDVARAAPLLGGDDAMFRRLAALALAENGDDRGKAVLIAWWQEGPPPFARAREVLAALAAVRAKEAAPVLIGALSDVRLRPYVAATLGALGHPSARAPLASYWATERFQTARVALGDALVRLGARRELVAPLVRFLGTPDPLPTGLDLATRAGVLAEVGGASVEVAPRVLSGAPGRPDVLVKLVVPRGGNGTGWRVLLRGRVSGAASGQVLISRPGAEAVPTLPVADGAARGFAGSATADPDSTLTVAFLAGEANERFTTLPPSFRVDAGSELRLVLAADPSVVVDAVAVVPLADELPPPAPVPWTAPDSESPDLSAPGPH